MAFFLVTGDLSDGPGHGTDPFVTFSCARQANAGERVAHMLPVMRNGTVNEIVDLPLDTLGVEWQSASGASIPSRQFALRRLGWGERTARMAYRVAACLVDFPAAERRAMGVSLRKFFLDLPAAYQAASRPRLSWPVARYEEWVARFGKLGAADPQKIRQHIESWRNHPNFRLLVFAGSAGDQGGLAATLASITDQPYRDFKVRVLDEAARVSEWADWDIAGDWLVFLRAGDRLAKQALYAFACRIMAQPDAVMVYSDDDTVDGNGQRCDPRFKPDWSVTHLRSTDFIGNAVALRGSAATAVWSGFPADEDAALYDLMLRLAERSGAGQVAHIPAALLHRAPPADAVEAGAASIGDERHMAAVRAHLARCGMSAEVVWTRPECWRVRHALPEPPPLVSIVIPTRDAVAWLRQCVESLLARTSYPHFEVLVVDNRSADPAALAYLDEIAGRPNLRVLRYDKPFNYSAINNFAVRQARGEVVCLLNNDTEVISPDWLEEMVGHLLQDRVGVVGAKLYYRDGRVQHAGDTVGPGGCANHLHSFLGHDQPGYCNRAVVAQALSAVTAACMVTRREVYLRLGGLDEKHLPIAFNDVDYCLRVRESGYTVVWTPHAELYHLESVSRKKDRSVLRMLGAKREARFVRQRWREAMRNDPYYNPNFSYARPDFRLTAMPRGDRPWECV